MRAKKRTRVLKKLKLELEKQDPRTKGFYDGLMGVQRTSDTVEYIRGYNDGERTRLQSAAVKLL